MRLAVDQGCFAYPSAPDRLILRDVTFSAEGGEIVAILGPNGAGKTTLLRCIMGFLDWKSGTSTLDGVPFRSLPPARLWQRLAYVPQARGKASSFTVLDMVLLGRSSRIGVFSQPGPQDIEAAHSVLAELGLEALQKRRCDEISGGELQMVLIARALVSRPECVILDEPESNLDYRNQLIVLETMARLKKQGIACIFNTHYPAHAMRYADKALLLDGSGSARFGVTEEMITEQGIADVFGVRSIIAELETEDTSFLDVFPVSILQEKEPAAGRTGPHLFALTLVMNDGADTEAVNQVFHEYSGILRGRFGLPLRDKKANVISVVFEAPAEGAYAMLRKFRGMEGVSAKAVLLKSE